MAIKASTKARFDPARDAVFVRIAGKVDEIEISLDAIDAIVTAAANVNDPIEIGGTYWIKSIALSPTKGVIALDLTIEGGKKTKFLLRVMDHLTEAQLHAATDSIALALKGAARLI